MPQWPPLPQSPASSPIRPHSKPRECTMELTWSGKAWVYGDDIPNDEGIMPLRLVRLQEYDPAELKKFCFEQIDDRFAKLASAGDVIFGGRNFGYGNPH